MPNLAKLYTELTRFRSKEEIALESKPQPEPDAGRSQAMQQWKASTITKEKINKYVKEMAVLVDESVNLAKSFPTHQNPHKIIANLIRVEQLNTIINDYV